MRAFAIVLALALAGCASAPPSIEPQPPLVDCRQPTPAPTPAAPRADQWVEDAQGGARVSQRAARWVLAILALREADGAQAAAQERCLDDLERAGHIRR